MSKHHERIGSALELLTTGLQGFVESRLRSVYNDAWVQAAASSFRDDRSRLAPGGDGVRWDAHALLTVMWDQWNAAFRSHLGHAERSLVSELREFRNRWAHQADFDFDDAYRVLDSVRRLLQAVQSPNLGAIQEQKRDLIESYVAEEVHTQMQRTAFNRNRWWVILIYALCCGAIIFHILNADMSASLFFVSTVLLVFIYLIYQQFKLEAPVLYGPHECPRCRKIIYRRSCPYCDA